LPDIDKAQLVVFSGSSAGGNGVKNNVDRVGELLRKTNKQCKGSKDCPLAYLGVIDANYPPSFQSVDLTQATFCTGSPFLCTYDDFYTNTWNQVNVATWGARGDESCVKWHREHQPGTEWLCADPQHVVHNHLTTPLFIHMDQQDSNIGGNFLDSNLATATQFGQLTHDQLSAVVDLDRFAEEGSVRGGGPRLPTPGVYGPQCTDHYGLSISKVFFGVTISDSGKRYSFHDILWNWVQGAQPQQIVHSFAGPGPASDCP
jgi:pectinacetylesterase